MDRLTMLWREYRLTVGFVAVLAIAYLFLRSPATPVEAVEDVTARLGQGQPVTVYFFSNT
jgi:hypothetical protein